MWCLTTCYYSILLIVTRWYWCETENNKGAKLLQHYTMSWLLHTYTVSISASRVIRLESGANLAKNIAIMGIFKTFVWPLDQDQESLFVWYGEIEKVSKISLVIKAVFRCFYYYHFRLKYLNLRTFVKKIIYFLNP